MIEIGKKTLLCLGVFLVGCSFMPGKSDRTKKTANDKDAIGKFQQLSIRDDPNSLANLDLDEEDPESEEVAALDKKDGKDLGVTALTTEERDKEWATNCGTNPYLRAEVDLSGKVSAKLTVKTPKDMENVRTIFEEMYAAKLDKLLASEMPVRNIMRFCVPKKNSSKVFGHMTDGSPDGKFFPIDHNESWLDMNKGGEGRLVVQLVRKDLTYAEFPTFLTEITENSDKNAYMIPRDKSIRYVKKAVFNLSKFTPTSAQGTTDYTMNTTVCEAGGTCSKNPVDMLFPKKQKKGMSFSVKISGNIGGGVIGYKESLTAETEVADASAAKSKEKTEPEVVSDASPDANDEAANVTEKAPSPEESEDVILDKPDNVAETEIAKSKNNEKTAKKTETEKEKTKPAAKAEKSEEDAVATVEKLPPIEKKSSKASVPPKPKNDPASNKKAPPEDVKAKPETTVPVPKTQASDPKKTAEAPQAADNAGTKKKETPKAAEDTKEEDLAAKPKGFPVGTIENLNFDNVKHLSKNDFEKNTRISLDKIKAECGTKSVVRTLGFDPRITIPKDYSSNGTGFWTRYGRSEIKELGSEMGTLQFQTRIHSRMEKLASIKAESFRKTLDSLVLNPTEHVKWLVVICYKPKGSRAYFYDFFDKTESQRANVNISSLNGTTLENANLPKGGYFKSTSKYSKVVALDKEGTTFAIRLGFFRYFDLEEMRYYFGEANPEFKSKGKGTVMSLLDLTIPKDESGKVLYPTRSGLEFLGKINLKNDIPSYTPLSKEDKGKLRKTLIFNEVEDDSALVDGANAQEKRRLTQAYLHFEYDMIFSLLGDFDCLVLTAKNGV